MITAKFGGSSMTPRNIYKLNSILTDQHQAVVVSAIGKENATDTKVTDLLFAYHQSHSQVVKDKIIGKYKRLARFVPSISIDNLLADAFSRIEIFNNLDYTLSVGEELSAKILARYLNATYIEAENVVTFRPNGELNLYVTLCNVRHAFDGVKLGVMGGFYGGENNNTRKVFTRGGSDITGALIASALSSNVYENWTDVSGVCVASPRVVLYPKTLEAVSYNEMSLFSKCGASVLHQSAVDIVKQFAVPICVKNFFNPFAPSTVVSKQSVGKVIFGLTESINNNLFTTCVLHNTSKTTLQKLINHIATFSHVLSVKHKPHILQITTNSSIIKKVYNIVVD